MPLSRLERLLDAGALRRSLMARTLTVVAIAAVVASAVFIGVTLDLMQQQIEQLTQESLNELIESMASMASIACFTKDATLATETAQSFIKNSNVMQVTIVAFNQPLAQATRVGADLGQATSRPQLTHTIFSPFIPGETVGSVELVPNWPYIENSIRHTVQYLTLILVGLASVIVAVVALVITYLVIRPVKTLSDQLHVLDAARGGVLKTQEHHENNELGRLVTDINELVARFRGALEKSHEIHLQQVVHERTRLFAAVFENSQEGITITDRRNNIVTVNQAFCQITGYAEAEVLGKNPRILASGRHNKAFYARMWHAINTSGFWKGELWNRCRNGDIKPKWFSISVVRDDDGEIVNHLAIFSDITERKQAEERIEFLAHHDALTKLPNRVLTRDRFAQAVAKAQRELTAIAVLYVDLDNFKYVNDSFGHLAGDQLLVTSVGRLKQFIRETDTVSRQGGDEFLIILPDISDPAVVERVASQILVNFASPFDIEGHTIAISASVGITFYPEHGEDFDTLLKNADAAMYAAKSAGKNSYRVFDEVMNVDALDKLKLKAMLRSAVNKKEFYLVYQPQFDIATNRIVGVEALIRWAHPEQGIIPPARFIPLAEESGLIGEIGGWVMEEACRQGKEWFDAGVGPFVVAVNVSSQQFVNGSILKTVKRVLERTGFPPKYLELEFTESGLLSDIQNSLSTIDAMRALDVKMSIDDFGTGYSSLSYLQQFKVEKLKIDQSFIRAIGSNTEGIEIVRAIIQLGKTLQLDVIAEGVETDLHLQTLRDLDCDEAQGFLFSRPLAAGELLLFLEKWEEGIVSGNHQMGMLAKISEVLSQ